MSHCEKYGEAPPVSVKSVSKWSQIHNLLCSRMCTRSNQIFVSTTKPSNINNVNFMHAIDNNYDFDEIADENLEINLNNSRDPLMQQFLQITDVIEDYNDAIEEYEFVLEEVVVPIASNSIATNKLKSSDKYLDFQKLILDFISVSTIMQRAITWRVFAVRHSVI
jgi:hypothetical protein